MEQLDLGPQAEIMKRLAAGVDDGQLDGPTPCPEYDVRTLLGHVLGLSGAFRDAARKDFGATTGTDPGAAGPALAADWRTRLPELLDELAASWRDPAAWLGETRAGGIELAAGEAGVVALNELLLHGWDLARATDQPYAPRPVDLEVSQAMLSAAQDPEQRGGAFGPVVPQPADAPLLDRVVGLAGREPGWRAGV